MTKFGQAMVFCAAATCAVQGSVMGKSVRELGLVLFSSAFFCVELVGSLVVVYQEDIRRPLMSEMLARMHLSTNARQIGPTNDIDSWL